MLPFIVRSSLMSAVQVFARACRARAISSRLSRLRSLTLVTGMWSSVMQAVASETAVSTAPAAGYPTVMRSAIRLASYSHDPCIQKRCTIFPLSSLAAILRRWPPLALTEMVVLKVALRRIGNYPLRRKAKEIRCYLQEGGR